jgi:hypothetical protein
MQNHVVGIQRIIFVNVWLSIVEDGSRQTLAGHSLS